MKLISNNRTKIILTIPAIIAIIAIIVLVTKAIFPGRPVITGIVETTQIDIASKIPGRVNSIFVREGNNVIRGQVLATLESKEMDAKVEQAHSAMEGARQKMEMALHGARIEEKEVTQNQYQQAKAQYELASKTWARVESIYHDSLVSTRERDQVEFQYQAAKEQMDAARAKYDMVMKGARSEEIAGAIALFHQAENAYKEVLAYQQELRLISPIDGEVSKKIVNEGEIVAGGYPVFTITKPGDIWVVLQVKEDQMKSITMGAKFEGQVRAIEQSAHEFEVSYIAPMADFATWKPTNQKGDFDVKTFEIHLRSTTLIPNLRAGMTVNITL
jgi:HlyD family secretion protein